MQGPVRPRLVRLTSLLAIALFLAFPGVAFAINLVSGGAFTFDIAETAAGTMSNGTVDSYDTAYRLTVNGTAYTAGGAAPTTSVGGRQLEMAEVSIGTLRVRRLVYVPMTGGDYARYLDVISNPGATDVTATVQINGNLGSDTSTLISGTSSGDTVLTTADTWFATDDTLDGSGDTSVAHVAHGGPGSVVAPSALTLASDVFTWSFDVTVPAGGQVAVLTFAVQAMTRAASIAEATRVVDLPADTLIGIEAFLADVVNFPVGGAPVVRFSAPAEVDEGDEITIAIDVTDLEGDTPTWSWDLDGDGTFGELTDVATYVVPAGTTDGPSTIEVAVEASDGTETRVVTRSVQVLNVAPAITTEPATSAAVRREYRYDVTVDDPGGDLDPPTLTLVAGPDGMSAVGTALTWTPPVAARAMTFPVSLRVLDGDDGEDVRMWEIAVAENIAPQPPTPTTPIDRVRVAADVPVTLVVTNAMDEDGDVLTYNFQISRVSSFTSGVVGSGEVTEGADGTTSWTTASELEPGLWYWRAWVSDGIFESTEAYASFWVGFEAPAEDAAVVRRDAGAGPDPEMPRASGCSVGVGASGGSPAVLLFLMMVWFVSRRERRTEVSR